MEQPHYISGLNQAQKEAVEHISGPLLVLAGAGTGKTRVLTSRIAHILSNNQAMPSQILAVTFTNKAAKEMLSRIQSLVGSDSIINWCGTFHSISAKILRQHAERIGFTKSFTILDMDDQIRLMKQILSDYNIEEKSNPAKLLAHIISRYKDKGWTPSRVPVGEAGQYANGMSVTLYTEYQKRLNALQSMDFGDLILYTIELFNNNLDLLEFYQNKFKYILVDEYQDTNVAQYLWLRLLAQAHHNICCVGDDDQSIYGWRGAEVKNILRFDKDFANAKIVRLERNYRSTSKILEAASALIAHNKTRHGKTLWTEDTTENSIKLSVFYDDRQEARSVADEVDIKSRLHKVPLSNMAILVRAGYQTRSFEESLNYMKIPYRIVGGAKFYDRAEIKDTLAYMRLLLNPDDGMAFERVINTPRRGIGDATVQEIRQYANIEEISMFAAADRLVASGQLRNRVGSAIANFIGDIGRWKTMLDSMTHVEVLDKMLDENGYRTMLKSEESEDSKDRFDNLKELLRSVGDYNTLSEYIEHVSLVTDMDSNADANKLNILTMHAAKGLEFDTVFLPGWEEGTFPGSRAISENGGAAVEEERRLAYVAITRAKKNLYISYACNRRIFGSYQETESSRFIDELPEKSYELINNFKRSGGSYRNNQTFEQKPQPAAPVYIKENKSDNGMKYGQYVVHKKFGRGKILAILGGDIAQVMFDNEGFKKIAFSYLEVEK